MVSPAVVAEILREAGGTGLGVGEQLGGREEGGLTQPSTQHFKASGESEGEGSGSRRYEVPDVDGRGEGGVPEDVCPTVRDYSFSPSSSSWPGAGYQSAFSGLEVDKTIDDFVHHHDLGYCPVITKLFELPMQFEKT